MRRRHLDNKRGPGLLHSQEPSESLEELDVGEAKTREEEEGEKGKGKEGGVVD